MYQEAEEKITEGLSPGARFLIGIFAFLFGGIMFMTASDTDAPALGIGIGVFCIVIGLTCATWGRVRQFLGSLIGIALFATAGWYLYDQMTAGPAVTASRSEPSVLNAVFFMLCFGIPGLTYALYVKFGLIKIQEPDHDPLTDERDEHA